MSKRFFSDITTFYLVLFKLSIDPNESASLMNDVILYEIVLQVLVQV